MGGFYDFKLHAIINSKGELIRIKLTPDNVDDRKPMPDLCQGLFGQVFADRGYIGQFGNGKQFLFSALATLILFAYLAAYTFGFYGRQVSLAKPKTTFA